MSPLAEDSLSRRPAVSHSSSRRNSSPAAPTRASSCAWTLSQDLKQIVVVIVPHAQSRNRAGLFRILGELGGREDRVIGRHEHPIRRRQVVVVWIVDDQQGTESVGICEAL